MTTIKAHRKECPDRTEADTEWCVAHWTDAKHAHLHVPPEGPRPSPPTERCTCKKLGRPLFSRHRWTKTSEKEPEDGRWVLGYFLGYPPGWLVTVPVRRVGDHYEEMRGSVPAPSHWMPLPEPPEEE